MNKDANLLAEAYERIIEEAKKHNLKTCQAAEKGCDCDDCKDCRKNQKEEVREGKNVKPDYLDLDGDKNKNESMKKAAKDAKKKKEAGNKPTKKSHAAESLEIANAYETILEYKLINKKFARRYNKLTSAMLKSQPGSEEYGKYKTEREDLVSILKDHGMTPKDLEEYLVKKEQETPLPEVPEPNNSANQYNDNSYSDTADIPSNIENKYEQDMAAPQAEVATMPPDRPAQQ